MPSKARIAIIGAGPAGCTLARLLLVSPAAEKLDITIFEGEASLDARTQGGCLDLHPSTGQAALKRAGLREEFLKHARFDGESFKLSNQHLQLFVNMKGSSGEKNSNGRPEIDRIDLRHILLDSLPEGMIKWDHRLKQVTLDAAGKPTLHFEHGEETGFDLVIGADGAWSKIRPLLSEEKPYYAGVSGWFFKCDHAEQRAPEAWKLANRGSIFSWGHGGRSIMAQQNTQNGALSISTWDVCPEDAYENEKFDTGDVKATKAALLDRHQDFHPHLRRFLEVADEDRHMHRNLYMLPIGHNWQHKPYLTLLGDAAHLMTPFAGEGVNLAMSDAMSLADSIITACNSTTSDDVSSDERAARLSQQVQHFEEDMFKRATKVQQMTKDMMDTMFFTKGAPEATVEKYIFTATADEVPRVLKPVVWKVVRAYFTWWRWKHTRGDRNVSTSVAA